MNTSTRHRIGVLTGDGIGAEIVPVATAVTDAAGTREGVGFDWQSLPFGRSAITEHGSAIPASTLSALDDLGIWIAGPHDNAGYPAAHRDGPPPGAVLRKHFGLSANLRPAHAFSGVAATAPEIDVLIVRENSEGLYADRNMAVGSGEFMPTPDVALAVGLITRAASERIAHQACRLAAGRSGRVTIVHKANVLRLSTGLFRDVCREVAAHYPGLVVDEKHVDAMAALLVRRPADFDVLVTENLFGDILSDLAGELAGSLGLAGSVNCSDRQVMAQAAHGAAPDIAGQGIANPVAIVVSTAMALRWWGLRIDDERLGRVADRIDAAVAATLADGVRTPDLGGAASTSEMGAALVARVLQGEQRS
ncbi:MAG: isocitrate/isopropylmalate family dehydrogenase [Gordonia sp. (in: high G+C Gram-positive bacteria)]